jgi:hypothetical protein
MRPRGKQSIRSKSVDAIRKVSLARPFAIHSGGLGVRIGQLAEQTPKPLLGCRDRPFLAWIFARMDLLGEP